MSLERYLEAAGRKNTQRRRTCRLLATITLPNHSLSPNDPAFAQQNFLKAPRMPPQWNVESLAAQGYEAGSWSALMSMRPDVQS